MDNKKETLEIMKELHSIQGSDGNWNYDPYMHGMFNGMEIMLATLEGREPEYKDAPAKWGSEDVGLQLDHVITNGYVDIETLEERSKKGWNFIATVPAKLIHPKAMDTDKATIFSKYVPYPDPVGSVPDQS